QFSTLDAFGWPGFRRSCVGLSRIRIMKRAIGIRVIVAVVAAVFVVGSWLQQGTADLVFLRLFSVAVLACTVVFNAWDLWLWRLHLVQRIPGVPRSIRGTWKGTLTSYWADPVSGAMPEPKTVFLVVRQTASRLVVSLLT